MSDTIAGALIALCGVLVAGFMQWVIEFWKSKRNRHQAELDKEKQWLEEIYFARTSKAILNIYISPERLSEWTDTNSEFRNIIFSRLSEMSWHAAKLRKSNLRGMVLDRMFMPAADFTEANLKGITLSNSFLPEAIFIKANFGLTERSLVTGERTEWTTSLFNSFFWRSDFTEADLTGADLTHANFCHSEFWSAIFKRADLSFAKFCDTNLGNADLRYSKLITTDFSESYIGKANFTGAKMDEFTMNTLKNAKEVSTAIFDKDVQIIFSKNTYDID